MGGLIAPVAARLPGGRGARLPAALGLALQAISFRLYATLTAASPIAVVVLAALVNGVGSAFFFPANKSAVIADAPPGASGMASGLLHTVSNVGMVTGLALPLLAAARTLPRPEAFAIFLGVPRLKASLALAFSQGLHAALVMALVGVAAVLSIRRGPEIRAAAD